MHARGPLGGASLATPKRNRAANASNLYSADSTTTRLRSFPKLVALTNARRSSLLCSKQPQLSNTQLVG
eukprot:6209476-Pleurochrysis_carterae.AAC.1